MTFLRAWLAERAPQIKASQLAAIEAQRRDKEERARFVAPFPAELHADLEHAGTDVPRLTEQEIARKIANALPDQTAIIVACSRALGCVGGYNANWTNSTEKERCVLLACENVDGKAFAEAVGKLKNDEAALRGAARLFFFERVFDRVPESSRIDLGLVLGQAVLRGESAMNAEMLLRFFSRGSDPRIEALLFKVVRGEEGKRLVERTSQEPSLPVAAAIALAHRRVTDVQREIERLNAAAKEESDRCGCEVALALLGDVAKLKPRHFELQSYAIGEAAIEAIERKKGAAGMDLLVMHGLQHPWAAVQDEAEETVQRIAGREFPMQSRRDAIMTWWEKEGSAFVEQRRKVENSKPKAPKVNGKTP